MVYYLSAEKQSKQMVLWSSGLSRLPVTEKIASSNLVRTAICECSSTVEHHLAKVDTAVRFRSLAPCKNSLESEFFCYIHTKRRMTSALFMLINMADNLP